MNRLKIEMGNPEERSRKKKRAQAGFNYNERTIKTVDVQQISNQWVEEGGD